MRRCTNGLGAWIWRIRGITPVILFLVCSAGCMLFHADAHAAAGGLDTSFHAPDGYYQYNYGSNTWLKGMALQSDGKIIATGYTTSGLILMRFNSNGTIDTDFATSGITLNPSGYGKRVAIQQDGKIVVTGHIFQGGGVVKIAIWRYYSNGTPDTGFGTNGAVIFPGYYNWETAESIIVQSDGKLVVAGSLSLASDTPIAGIVIRYNTDGTLDNSFGAGGVVTMGSQIFPGWFSGVVVQSDGRLLVCGTDGLSSGVFVLRFNTNGTQDPAFGTSGFFTYDPGNNEKCSAITVQSDGKIIVGGTINTGDGLLLLRLNSSGALDSGFGTAGAVRYTGGGASALDDMALQGNGKIVAGGKSFLLTGESQVFSVWRFNSNGSIDSGFGTGGVVIANYANTPGNEEARSVLVQPDGKIIAAGEVYLGFNTGGFIMRLLPRYISIVANITGSGTVDCSPNPVPEGTAVSCYITPSQGNYLSNLRVGTDPFGMLFIDPLWIVKQQVYNGPFFIVEPLFESAAIGLYAPGVLPGTMLLKKTDNNFVDAFADTAASNYEQIRVLSGAYFDLTGIACTETGRGVIPKLTGGWSDLSTQGTVPTLLAPRFTISGSCALEIDKITIQ